MSRSRPLYSVRSGVKTWDNDSSSREKLPRLLGRDGFGFLFIFYKEKTNIEPCPGLYSSCVCLYLYARVSCLSDRNAAPKLFGLTRALFLIVYSSSSSCCRSSTTCATHPLLSAARVGRVYRMFNSGKASRRLLSLPPRRERRKVRKKFSRYICFFHSFRPCRDHSRP